MRTWLVQYPPTTIGSDYPDEVDAPTLAEAEALAEILYDPGYALVEIEPGGSGGLVMSFRSPA